MDEGLLSLKWNNHKPAFAHLLKVLRQKGCYTDVTLACGSKFFEVHRLVLIACSEFFTNVFDRITCQKPVIVLNEVKSQELEALLDYMYLGEVDVQQKHLPGLIKAAEYLLIKGLAVPDEDPLQNSNKNKTDDGAERPTKRRRQDRESRDSERQAERENLNTYKDQHYSKTRVLDAEIIEEGTSSDKRIPTHVDKDKPFEVELVESHEGESKELKQDAHSSLGRVQQKDLQNVEKRKNNDSRTVYDLNNQNRKNSFSQENIKTEQCDDISEIEEIDNSEIKTELDIRNESVIDNSSGDFSRFLSSNVEGNITAHMFESPHQSGPGPSGLQGHMGLETGVSDGIGDDGRGGGSSSDLFPSHLMASDVLPDGAAGSQMGPISSLVQMFDSPTGPAKSRSELWHGMSTAAQLSFSFDSQATNKASEPNTYECMFCGRIFNHNGTLKRHIMTHTGEKPYHCQYCSFKTARKSTLSYHLHSLHDIAQTNVAGSTENIDQSMNNTDLM